MSLPRITIEQDKHDGWHCTIHDGPGHHGVGESKAEALARASMAWVSWESQIKAKRNPSNTFFLRRNGYYFRPNAQGYTASYMEAGLFSQDVAESYVKNCEGVTMHHAPV